MTTLRALNELLEAATALLEARANQMLTKVEWDQLRKALANFGCTVPDEPHGS